MKTKYIVASLLVLASASFTSCSEDESDILLEPPVYEDELSQGAFGMKLQGKIEDGPNKGEFYMVYVDLSAQKQIQEDPNSWHLGFSTDNEARVTLNQSLSRAYSTGKTNFAEVTEEDAKAESFPNLAGGMMDFPNPTEYMITDDTDRDLEKTVFGNIATSESQSEVFLVATAKLTDRSTWFKVKVTATDNGYVVNYGNVNDVDAKKVVIKKNTETTMIALSLEDGKVYNLPTNWDIMWSSAMAVTTMPNGKKIPGPANDVVTSNRYEDVETAQVMVADVCSFEDFTSEHLDKVNFVKDADLLGTDWRVGGGPGSSPGPKADRFYVLKDKQNKYFKFRFIHYHEADGGVRGIPELEAAFLK